jgi:hypothetical protein
MTPETRPSAALAQAPRAGPAGADSDEARRRRSHVTPTGAIPVGTSMGLTNVESWLQFSELLADGGEVGA